jgi:hypothetical protein|tara:strand:- start:109 stop:543 length:435 start_codon:yes stop_codon:yes gene_type:complete
MSGMHLLPIYYTTTVHSRKRKKSRKVSKSMQEAQRKHDKFLKSMGISTENKRSVAQSGSASALGAEGHRFKSYRSDQKGHPPKTERVSKAFPSENIYDKDWSPCPKKPAPINTGNHVIGQAYNKGNYQVLSSSEVKDDMTGKRR